MNTFAPKNERFARQVFMTPPPSGRSGRGKSGGPNPIDVHVGARLRLRRTLLGMSQEKLGHALGLTFQQVQKYERGANRIGASRLYDLSRVLDVPVSFFFEEMAPGLAGPPAKGEHKPKGMTESESAYQAEPMMKRETLELVRAYLKIADAQLRRRVFELAKAIAGTFSEG
jgi:transcriptional regulator with XRE-family HTH domain